MKRKLKLIFKTINKDYPVIGSFIRRVHQRKLFNTIKRKVRGKNNIISHKAALLSSVTIDIVGNNNTIEIKEDCILNNVTFYIRGNGHKIIINKGCRFTRGSNIWIEDSNCLLEIGDNSTFEDVHLALTEPDSKILIGKNCMFAYDIDVRTGDSHSIISKETNKCINYAKDITIGDHVWIAAHNVLLKGVSIPNDSVVATGSIVTKTFTTEGIIIGGNPARKLKDKITWSRERAYLIN